MPRSWLILGGSSSVGRAFALQAAAGGADILLAGRDLADLERTAADVRVRTGRRAEAIAFDADPDSDHDGFVASCRARGVPLDVFLLFGAMPAQEAIDHDFALARQTVTVNYLGAMSILARLALGEATVMELAEPFDMTQPAISRHLKVLEGAGLITRRVEGTKRPCRLAPAAVTEIDQWLAMLRQALSANYDRLDDVLAAMKTEE